MSDATTMQYRVLGPVTAEDGGGPQPLGGPKRRLVLAMLLLEPDRVVLVDRIIDAVWNDDPPAGAAHSVQGYVSELRGLLPDAITFESGGYRLHADPARIDSRRFEVLLAAGQRDLEANPVQASSFLCDALALWRGEPYADLRYADALQIEIGRLDVLRTTANELRVEADLALGRHGQLVSELEALTREHPFHERFWEQLMLALHRSGRRADALRVFERARRALAEELGVEPSAALTDLRERVSEGDPGLAPLTQVAGESSTPVARGFELRQRMGGGDLGHVFAAYQASLGREVAVKVLNADVVNQPGFVRDFEAVTQRVAALEHPNILPLLDAWRDPGAAFLVTPLLSGGDLEHALAGGAWEIPAVLRVVGQVGAALAHAHRAGVAHGALGPADVLLDVDGNAFVADLGVAQLIAAQPSRGETAGLSQSVGRSDLASLGQLTYRMLTSLPTRPDRDEDISALRSGVPREVGTLLGRALLAKPPDSADAIEDFLRELRRAFGVDASGILRDGRDDAVVVSDPYKGLRAFEEADADDFFGRDGAIALALKRLQDHRVVAIVGSSGSGKSSLVRAGLMPALRRGALPGSSEWLTAIVVPGAFPFEQLVRALRALSVTDDPGAFEVLQQPDGLSAAVDLLLPPDARLLLVVDQLEEVFSMVVDPQVRDRFLSALARAADRSPERIRVIVTARADFFDRFLDEAEFGPAMREGLVALSMPSAEELALAITGPAGRVGLRLEPGLAEQIVADVSGRPGALPLMQHVLTELVRARSGRTLTLEAYHAVGGAAGALGNRAEAVFADLEPTAHAVAADVFMRLTLLDEGGAPVRHRATLAELRDLGLARQPLEQVLQAFGSYRLLAFDRDPMSRGPTVEVVHEALFTEWGRLAGWIDDRRDGLMLQRRLAAAMAEWHDAGRDPSYTLRGSRLAAFERWSTHTDVPLSADEREYLHASRVREAAAARKDARRRRVVFTALTTVTLLAVLFGVFGWSASQTANREESASAVRELIARSAAAAAADHDLGILLAAEAVRLAQMTRPDLIVTATARLHGSILEARRPRSLKGYGEVAWDRSGRYLAFGDDLGHKADPGGIRVVDIASGESVTYLAAPDGTTPFDLGWSPDGRQLVVTYRVYDRTAAEPWNPDPARPLIWDLGSGSPAATLPGQAGTLYRGPVFSPDGSQVAASREEMITVWERDARATTTAAGPGAQASPEPAYWRLHYRVPIVSPGLLEFDPTGSLLAVGDGRQTIHLLDASSGSPVQTLGSIPGVGGVVDVAWSPDGRKLAALAADGHITVLEPHGDGELLDFSTRNGQRELDWSPDGTMLAVGGDPGVVTVWNAENGVKVAELAGRDGTITGLAWSSPAPGLLAGAGQDGPVHVWESFDEGEVATLSSSGVAIEQVRWTPDERYIIGHGADGAVRLWPATGGTPIVTLPGQQVEPPISIAMSPDGQHVAITGPEWSTMLVETETLTRIWGQPEGGAPASFSADGRFISTGHDGIARVLDARTGSPVAKYVVPVLEPGHFFLDARFLAGDRWILLIEPGASPRLWEWRTGDVRTLDYRIGDRAAAVSPDGSRFAVGGDEMAGARVWDATAFLAGEAPEPEVIQEGLPLPTRERVQSFALDGSQLLSGSLDGQVTFWDLETGEAVRSLPAGSAVGSASMSKDGIHLLVGSDPVRVLTLSPDELLDIADRRVTRSLSTQECREYLRVESCPDHSGSTLQGVALGPT